MIFIVSLEIKNNMATDAGISSLLDLQQKDLPGAVFSGDNA